MKSQAESTLQRRKTTAAAPFAPAKLTTIVRVAKTAVYLYPKFDPSLDATKAGAVGTTVALHGSPKVYKQCQDLFPFLLLLFRQANSLLGSIIVVVLGCLVSSFKLGSP